MAKGLKIEKSILKIKGELNYNRPKFVYIPLFCTNDVEPTILAKKKDKVLIGTPIAKTKGEVKMNITSTVSGEVIDYVAMTYKDKKVKCIKIKNDFKDTKEVIKIPKKITKNTFIKLLQDSHVIGHESNIPVYQKYEKNIKTLIVNATESEPFLTSDVELLKTHTEEILECIDSLLDINEISNAIIVIKETDYELIEILNDYIGTYLRIKIYYVPNVYPIGFEDNIKKEVLRVNSDEVIVDNVYTIYEIYNALKGNILTEKLVTFVNQDKKESQNVLIRVGTPVVDALKSLFSITDDKAIISGGPMRGVLSDTDLIVTKDLKCVMITSAKETKQADCMRCGKCINICPVGLFPCEIIRNIDNVDALKKMHVEKCIECGLCAYICPAKQEVLKYIREAKGKIR